MTSPAPLPSSPELSRLLPHPADLEFEVDRLREREQFVQHSTRRDPIFLTTRWDRS